ncbi:MAG: LacI family DNA-binding transcriptional regulator [Rubrivivax sp.]
MPRHRSTAEPALPTATIHDVAALAEVSLMTVSRALKQPHQVSAATLEKVLAAVKKTGYVPNALAGGLRSARTRLIAALVPTLKSHVYDPTIQALHETLSMHGYQLLLGQTDHSPSKEEDLLRAIIGRRPDGIVVTGILHSRASRALLLRCGIPIVETNDWTPTPIDMLVGFSHERMGHDACRFLAAKGRTKLALITGDDPRARRRAEGFLAAAADLRLAAPRMETLPAPTDHAGGRSAMARLLGGPGFDAVYCGSDMIALGVLTETRVRGIGVPDAVAVLGSGDLDFSATVVPALTTVKVDLDRIGRLAGQFVIARSEGRPVEDGLVDVGYTIVERDSA